VNTKHNLKKKLVSSTAAAVAVVGLGAGTAHAGPESSIHVFPDHVGQGQPITVVFDGWRPGTVTLLVDSLSGVPIRTTQIPPPPPNVLGAPPPDPQISFVLPQSLSGSHYLYAEESVGAQAVLADYLIQVDAPGGVAAPPQGGGGGVQPSPTPPYCPFPLAQCHGQGHQPQLAQ
jgi:hypothetical protein